MIMKSMIEKKVVLRCVTALAVAAAVLSVAGCRRNAQKEEPQDKIRIEKLENFRAVSLTSYELDLSVANDTRYAVVLEEGIIDIFYGEVKLGSILSGDEVEIPKRSVTTVTLPLVLEIENPLALYGVYTKLARGETDRINLSVRARFRAAGQRRTFEQTGISLSALLSALGADAGDLGNFLQF